MDFPETAGTPVIETPFHQRLRHARWAVGIFGALRLLVQSVGGALVGGVLQISLKLFFSLPVEWIRGSWILIVGFFLASFVRALRRLRPLFGIRFVTEQLGGQPRDLFLTAWELTEQNSSEDFQRRAWAQAEKSFPARWVGRLVPAGAISLISSVTLALFLFLWLIGNTPGPLLNKALWPFQTDPSGILSVHPGNAFFPRGEDVVVTIRVSTSDVTEPRLDVRSQGDAWAFRPLYSETPGVYTTVLRALQDPLDYRVLCKNGRSSFRLTPFDPPKLIRLQAHIDPPAYTGRKTEVLQDILSLRIMKGSQVRWSLETDPSDSLLRIENAPAVKKTGNEWSWTEIADQKIERRLWARRSNGSEEVLLTDLTIDPISDAPPQVTLLAPSEDIQTDGKDRIPLTLELTDDVGLATLGITFRVNQGSWTTKVWNHFPPGTVHDIRDEEFDLSALFLNAGDFVDFYVSARDGCSPPGEGRSETRRMEVLDFDGIHATVMESLGAFQKALGDRLAEERAVRENVTVSTPNWGGLLTEQRQVARRLKKDEENVIELLDQMAQDPGMDRGTFLEHQGLGERLKDLNRSTLPDVDRSLREENSFRSARILDQAIAELERMAHLSAEAVRAQDTHRLLRDQSDLSNMAENVARSLAEKTDMSEEDSRQFQETVQAMQEAMNRIRDRVENLQKHLSEEDLKNAKVEALRFDRVSRALSRLTQALQQKNGEDALAAAKDVLEQLRVMERQLNRASESLSSYGSETEAALTEEQEQLNKLIHRQEALLDRTLDMPKDIVPPWVEEQIALAGDTRSLSAELAETSRRTALLSPSISQHISTAADVMDGAAHSLRSLDVQSAQSQEEKALELLRIAEESLSQTLQNMRSLSKNAGTGGAPTLRRSGKGNLQAPSGDVKLPRADDFRPPAEFRQEILDSMKETYPPDQEGPVQDYYRHWTK
jgi:hypothetical protein